MKKRVLYPLLLSVAALSLSSCATQTMIAKAQGRPGPTDPPNLPPGNPNAAYYTLVPLTLPFDLLFWPVQYFYLKENQSTGAPPPQYQGDSQYLYSQPTMQPYRPPRPEPTPSPYGTWQ